MPKSRPGRSLREKVGEHPALVFLAGAIVCLVSAVGPLCGGDGGIVAAYIILAIAGVCGFLPLVVCAGRINRWKWIGVGILWVAFLVGMGSFVPKIATALEKRRASTVAQANPQPTPPPAVSPPVSGKDAAKGTPSRAGPGRSSPQQRSAKAASPAPRSKPTPAIPATPQRMHPPPVQQAQAPVPPAPTKDDTAATTPTVEIKQENVHGANVVTTGPNSPVTVNPEPDPNAWDESYFPTGGRRRQRGEVIKLDDGEKAVYTEIKALHDAHDWASLAKVCEDEIAAVPNWHTPYYYAGIAHGNLGDPRKAIERLERFRAAAEGDPTWETWYKRAGNMLDLRRSELASMTPAQGASPDSEAEKPPN